MLRNIIVVASLLTWSTAFAQAPTTQVSRIENPRVTGIKAACRNGQTFVTWTDVAEGEAGKDFRYRLLCSDKPITAENAAQAEVAIDGILNNSGRQYGYDLFAKTRIEPDKPMAIIAEGEQPLPQWSGLAVHTVAKDGNAYYAVVATDAAGKALSPVVAGESATVEPVEEKVAPIQPVKIGDSKTRGTYANTVKITGAKQLPLWVELHASSSQGSPGYDHGDSYLYWGRPEWGYRDGLPWQFAIIERDYKEAGRRLEFSARETMANPNGPNSIETYWFGYYCKPQWSKADGPRAYNFTELRTLWMIDWVIKRYEADPERVYAGGGSMGAWGSSTFAFRNSRVFAAVYPNRPRTRQRGMPSLAAPLKKGEIPLMDDGQTSYYDRMDMVKFAAERHEDLPFLGWCCGRKDGFASFKEQIDMVKAMTAGHHGFAFAWNDGDHSSGSAPMREVTKYYPWTKFARNRSYPAFGNSSLNDDMGSGEVEETVDGKKMVCKDGKLEGGINLGFAWSDVVDEDGKWSAKLSNELAKEEMTVDVTPRRCQKFKPKAGEKFRWTNSAGGAGEAIADQWGLVTIEKVKIKAGERTELAITR